jgi:hypothetical protein
MQLVDKKPSDVIFTNKVEYEITGSFFCSSRIATESVPSLQSSYVTYFLCVYTVQKVDGV